MGSSWIGHIATLHEHLIPIVHHGYTPELLHTCKVYEGMAPATGQFFNLCHLHGAEPAIISCLSTASGAEEYPKIPIWIISNLANAGTMLQWEI